MSEHDPASVADPGQPRMRLPERIGPYEIFGVLGRGGMGVVYRAVQHEPIKRDVALKTIAIGLDGGEVTARFEAERQVLARMSHPSIAQVFDAGVTEDGQSYFAMEYVAGVPLGEYCDARRLPVEARTRLFVKICRAVHHAHQKGVIHRDLKPSNVLVIEMDDEPLPKVIDFGIAKATEGEGEERARLTQDQQVLGTPIYMSPEQIEGNLDIDTRTDVYALGVMLYEILVGALPHPRSAYRGWAAMAAALVHEPPTLSRRLSDLPETQHTIAQHRSTDVKGLRRQLTGDLEWIVAKALEKARDRRYDSANALADDLERYLGFEPVLAGPPSRSYRARKFVRRHRVAVAAAVVMVAGLAGGAIAATLGLVRATTAERAALASAIVAQADAADHPLLAALLLSELDGKPEPAGGLSVASEVASGPIPRREFSHMSSVRGVAVGPAGEWIVTVEDEGAHLWRVDGSGPVHALTGHRGDIIDVSISSDGQRVLTSGLDTVLMAASTQAQIWSVATGQRLGGADSWSPFFVWAHHPDGRRILGTEPSTSKAVLRFADGSDSQVELVEHPGAGAPGGCEVSCRVAAFSEDGTLVALGSDDGHARVWRSDDGSLVAAFSHAAGVAALDFSPDGSWLVISSADGRVQVWPLDGGAPTVFPKSSLGRFPRVVFGPVGERIAVSATTDSTWIWDFKGSAEVLPLSGPPFNVSFGPGGQLFMIEEVDGARIYSTRRASTPVVTGGSFFGQFLPAGAAVVSATGTSMGVWPVFERAGVVVADPLAERSWSARLAPDGATFRTVAVGEPSLFRSFRVGRGGDRGVIEERVIRGRAVAMGDDGSAVATVDRETVLVWRPESGEPPIELPGPPVPRRRMWMSREGDVLAAVLQDNSVAVWRTEDESGPHLLPISAIPTGGSTVDFPVAVSPDGKWVGVIVFTEPDPGDTADVRSTVEVWSTADLSSPRSLVFPEGAPYFLRFGHGSRWLGGSADGATIAESLVYLWDAENDFELHVLGPYDEYVTDIRPTHDGTLAVVSEGARVWLEPLVEGVARRQILNREMVFLAAASDGGRLVAAAGPTAIHLWDTSRPGGAALVFRGPSSISVPLGSVDVSADGTRVLTGFQGRPRVWLTDWDEIISSIRNSTTSCLTADQRARYLLESPGEAAEGNRACEQRNGR